MEAWFHFTEGAIAFVSSTLKFSTLKYPNIHKGYSLTIMRYIKYKIHICFYNFIEFLNNIEKVCSPPME